VVIHNFNLWTFAATFTDRIVYVFTTIDHHITFTEFHKGLRMTMKVKIRKIKVGERSGEVKTIVF